jgi:hypothetical protein
MVEQQPSEDGALPAGEPEAGSADPDAAPTPPHVPTGPEAAALAMEAEEIRRLVEAGAGTPDAIRELAARLREHREREEALWRAQVKPALVKEGKGRLRGHGRSSAASSRPGSDSATSNATSNALVLGLLVLGLVLVVVIAASTTVWVLGVPVVALLVWAWQQGRSTSG